MAEHRGAPVEVLRLGVPGTGPPFYLRMWELEGARLRARSLSGAQCGSLPPRVPPLGEEKNGSPTLGCPGRTGRSLVLG
jgi:hypothetical protein